MVKQKSNIELIFDKNIIKKNLVLKHGKIYEYEYLAIWINNM